MAAWREMPYFTEAERAALALAESATRLADRPDPVPEEVWDEAAKHYDEPQLAAIVLSIAAQLLALYLLLERVREGSARPSGWSARSRRSSGRSSRRRRRRAAAAGSPGDQYPGAGDARSGAPGPSAPAAPAHTASTSSVPRPLLPAPSPASYLRDRAPAAG